MPVHEFDEFGPVDDVVLGRNDKWYRDRGQTPPRRTPDEIERFKAQEEAVLRAERRERKQKKPK